MAESRRKRTVLGIGAVRSAGSPESGQEDRGDDPAPLGMRDTLPAPPDTPEAPTAARESGALRRMTLQGLADDVTAAKASASVVAAPSSPPSPVSGVVPAPATRTSAPPTGRYSSSHPVDDDIVVSRPSTVAPSSPTGRTRRASREPLRVDAVGSTTLVAPHTAGLSLKPRLVERARIAASTLSMGESFVLALVDGSLTVRDLVDATCMPEREVNAILTRLVRLGLVSLSS